MSSAHDTLTQSILACGSHIITYPGISQYSHGESGSGASSCGLAALNFARLALRMRQTIVSDTELFATITRQETFEVCLIK